MEKVYCMNCANFIRKKDGARGGIKGSCKLRNSSNYKDIRYGKSTACKSHFERIDVWQSLNNQSVSMIETEEEFIFTTIYNWLCEHQIVVSKALLVDAIRLHQKTYPEKWGIEKEVD